MRQEICAAIVRALNAQGIHGGHTRDKAAHLMLLGAVCALDAGEVAGDLALLAIAGPTGCNARIERAAEAK